MSLLGLLFGEVEAPHERRTAPQALRLRGEKGVFYAPVAGTVLALEDVPDPLFATGALGPGVGITPADNIVYAPVDGTVTFIPNTLHAVGIRSDDGLDILIHVGVDTVDLKGEGFVGFVKSGQPVRAGEPLMGMELDKIAEAGYSDVVIMVVTNARTHNQIIIDVPGTVSAGEELMRLTR